MLDETANDSNKASIVPAPLPPQILGVFFSALPVGGPLRPWDLQVGAEYLQQISTCFKATTHVAFDISYQNQVPVESWYMVYVLSFGARIQNSHEAFLPGRLWLSYGLRLGYHIDDLAYWSNSQLNSNGIDAQLQAGIQYALDQRWYMGLDLNLVSIYSYGLGNALEFFPGVSNPIKIAVRLDLGSLKKSK